MDIIERLRLGNGTSPDHELLLEAAIAIESLRQQLAEAQKSPWISVEDRLPICGNKVLLMWEKTSHIEDGEFYLNVDTGNLEHMLFDGESLNDQPDYWMPLLVAPMRKEAK